MIIKYSNDSHSKNKVYFSDVLPSQNCYASLLLYLYMYSPLNIILSMCMDFFRGMGTLSMGGNSVKGFASLLQMGLL